MTSVLNEEMITKAMKEGTLAWGNLEGLSEAAVRELGLEGAIAERNRISTRRSSSGKTSSMERKFPTRKEAKAWRKGHYTRKAIIERDKEAKRRAVWERRHPGAHESNWDRRQAERKTRKARFRAFGKRPK